MTENQRKATFPMYTSGRAADSNLPKELKGPFRRNASLYRNPRLADDECYGEAQRPETFKGTDEEFRKVVEKENLIGIYERPPRRLFF